MKKKKLKSKDEQMNIYALVYIIKYLRCIIVEAQIEKTAIAVFVKKHNFEFDKLNKLNNKHNKLANNLYYQKLKMEYIR